jgi:hypothetical protein
MAFMDKNKKAKKHWKQEKGRWAAVFFNSRVK